jgi:hypothetical protein
VDAEDTPVHWIPELAEEAIEGTAKLVPVLNANPVGAGFLFVLLIEVTACAMAILFTLKSPQPSHLLQGIPTNGLIQTK